MININTGIFVTITAIFIIALSMIETWQYNMVSKSSKRLESLKQLNESTKFYNDLQNNYHFSTRVNSKPKFDRFNFDRFLDETVWDHPNLRRAAQKLLENRLAYQKYIKQADHIESSVTPEEAASLHIPFKRYIHIEEQLFQRNKLNPLLDSKVELSVTYVSPKGRNRYHAKEEYPLGDVIPRYDDLVKKEEQKTDAVIQRQHERSLMTDKLRYSILKRDGFRCQICGRGAEDGVKLHVDHIIPVSKGGKTVPENLRTLCEDCNLGKGDELE